MIIVFLKSIWILIIFLYDEMAKLILKVYIRINHKIVLFLWIY